MVGAEDSSRSVLHPVTVSRTPQDRLRATWIRCRWFAPALVALLAVRLRFFFVPIHPDESAQWAVARAWHRGATLYSDIWLDRPIGMLGLYRLVVALGLPPVFGLRLLAVLMAVLASYVCGRIAARLGGTDAAMVASLAAAILLGLPRLSGYAANGELMSGAFGALGLLLLMKGAWRLPAPNYGNLVLAGAATGVGLSIKQSAFDAFGAGLLVLLIQCARSGWDRRDRWLAVPAALSGLFVVLGVVMVHGVLTSGLTDWWDGVAGFRIKYLGAVSGARYSLLLVSGKRALPASLLLVLVLASLAVLAVRRHRVGALGLLGAWLGLAAVAFLSGGLFWLHYWLVLLFPASVALGVLVCELDQRRLRLLAATLALLPAFALGLRAAASPRSEVGDAVNRKFERIASWIRDRESVGRDSKVYSQCRGLELYGLVESDPPVKYLFPSHIQPVPERRAELAELFRGPDAPRFVVQFQAPEECDPSGVMREVLDSRYRQVAVVDGIPILERMD